MTPQFKKFRDTLDEIFMLDHAELDFGIYRIMNQKREDIGKYLDSELEKQVQAELKRHSVSSVDADKQELAKLEATLRQAGVDPETSPKVQELKAKIGSSVDMVSLEAEVYNHLATFFKRYYEGGDFMSMRRYKKDVYAIPYEGEEVKLHWANADQYYIKTSEYFQNYTFKTGDDRLVDFRLRDASTEQNNNKIQGDQERKFRLCENDIITEENGELNVWFTYEPMPKATKQKQLQEEAFRKLKDIIPVSWQIELFRPAPTEKDKARTLLEKHINDYVSRNSFDYFIHKDLGGFLRRELDFYIKNEVFYIDDIDTQNPEKFLGYLSQAKTIKAVGVRLITFLAQLEDFQKKLWLKKKFVVECNYCITLDRVPQELYPEVASNDAQREEWVRLFAIDEIKAGAGDMFGGGKVAYSSPLTVEFLKNNPYLVLDTAFFDERFKQRLVQSIDNFDEQLDGTLINSENFQALNLLQEKFREQVKCIYIDPPYNAKSSEIMYKNTFKHSSWLTLMDNRVRLASDLLNSDSVSITAIDEVENEKLGLLLDEIFNNYSGKTCVSVVINPSGQQGKNFSTTHENLFFYYNDTVNKLSKESRDEDTADVRGFMNGAKGEDGNYLRETGKNCFYAILIEDNEVVGFGDVCDDNFHPSASNIVREDGMMEVYPIDNEGIERKWLFERKTVESIIDQLSVKTNRDTKKLEIIRTKTQINYKTVWTDSKYSAKEYGTSLLKKMFGRKAFTFPKSINAVADCLQIAINEDKMPIVLDYFAGSGTTGHAVINLNREDEGKRKYILVEMGTYFDSVTKPRIQKVIYSKDWKDGKPVSRAGSSHCFKYMRLEQYEDTLNNLVLSKGLDFSTNNNFGSGFLLGYMLDTEARGSLFNTKWFENPFDFRLRITRNNELTETRIDLVETFNYLIGLNVAAIQYPKTGLCVIEGITRRGERTLVLWRDCSVIDNAALVDTLRKLSYNTLDTEFDTIYVNGDNTLQNTRRDDEHWKVTLIEEEFANRMFEK